MDSEKERVGESWDRGSGVVSLHTHSCAYVFMFCFMRANVRVGEQQKGGRACNSCEWGEVLKMVTHVQESILFHAGKWAGVGNSERAGVHAIPVSGVWFCSW